MENLFTGEKWKAVVGQEGRYVVSSWGVVVSLEKTRIQPHGGTRVYPKIEMKTPISRGYLRVQLSFHEPNKTNKSVWKSVHRLVAEAFIPNPKNLPQVNHINGIKSDNRVENLEWCTAQQNIAHACDTGLRTSIGENCHTSKLKIQDVVNIRLLSKSNSVQEIHKLYPFVHSSGISKIIKGETWKHIK